MGEYPLESPSDVGRAIHRVRLRPSSVLRIEGRFGSFIGRADSVGLGGLYGLRPDSRFDAVQLKAPPDPAAWSELSRVEYRGNAAGRGALIFGILFGLSGAGIGAAISQSDFAPPNDTGGAVIGGGVVGATIGAVVGGGLGP